MFPKCSLNVPQIFFGISSTRFSHFLSIFFLVFFLIFFLLVLPKPFLIFFSDFFSRCFSSPQRPHSEKQRHGVGAGGGGADEVLQDRGAGVSHWSEAAGGAHFPFGSQWGAAAAHAGERDCGLHLHGG
jgi:hypothetical protein